MMNEQVIKGMLTEECWGAKTRREERDHQGDLDTGGQIILEWMLRATGWGGMDWIEPIQGRDGCRTFVNTVMNLHIPQNVESNS